jgi:polyferredoxin
MGIDIREGLQLECIGCGLCIDACNDVMQRIGRPRELITMDTERNQTLRAAGNPTVHPIVRPRTVIYAAILFVVASVILLGLGARAAVDINILPERNPLYVTLSDGSIRNGYTIKILSKSHEPRTYDLTLEGLEGARLSVVGRDVADSSHAELSARPDTVTAYRTYVTAPPAAVSEGSQPLTMALTDREGGETARHETVFRGPEQ